MTIAEKIYSKIINYDPEYCGEGAEWSEQSHFEMLKRYADLCKSVTEFGVYDWNTTWSFVNSSIKKLRCYDGKERGKFSRKNGGYNDVVKACEENEIDFKFVKADTRTCDIDETDMLFIDTWHTYDQVKAELRLADKVNKFILFHDTVLYGETGSGGEEGILRAIDEFLQDNPDWIKLEDNKTGNGLLAIKRIT